MCLLVLCIKAFPQVDPSFPHKAMPEQDLPPDVEETKAEEGGGDAGDDGAGTASAPVASEDEGRGQERDKDVPSAAAAAAAGSAEGDVVQRLKLAVQQKVRIDDVRTMEAKVEESRRAVRQLEHRVEAKRATLERREAGAAEAEALQADVAEQRVQLDAKEAQLEEAATRRAAVEGEEGRLAARLACEEREARWLRTARRSLEAARERLERRRQGFQLERQAHEARTREEREVLRALGQYVARRKVQMQKDLAEMEEATRARHEVVAQQQPSAAGSRAAREKAQRDILDAAGVQLQQLREALAAKEKERLEYAKRLKEQGTLAEKMKREAKWAVEACRAERQKLKDVQAEFHAERFRLEQEEARGAQLELVIENTRAASAQNTAALRQRSMDLDEAAAAVAADIARITAAQDDLVQQERAVARLEAQAEAERSTADREECETIQMQRDLEAWDVDLRLRRDELHIAQDTLAPAQAELDEWLEELLWRETEVVGGGCAAAAAAQAAADAAVQAPRAEESIDLVAGIVDTHLTAARVTYTQSISTARAAQARQASAAKRRGVTGGSPLRCEVGSLARAFARAMGKLRIDPRAAAGQVGTLNPSEVAILQHVTRRERALRMRLRTLWILERCPLNTASPAPDRVLTVQLTLWWREARAAVARRRLDVLAERKEVLLRATRKLREKCPSVAEELTAERKEVLRQVGTLTDAGALVRPSGKGERGVVEVATVCANLLGIPQRRRREVSKIDDDEEQQQQGDPAAAASVATNEEHTPVHIVSETRRNSPPKRVSRAAPPQPPPPPPVATSPSSVAARPGPLRAASAMRSRDAADEAWLQQASQRSSHSSLLSLSSSSSLSSRPTTLSRLSCAGSSTRSLVANKAQQCTLPRRLQQFYLPLFQH